MYITHPVGELVIFSFSRIGRKADHDVPRGGSWETLALLYRTPFAINALVVPTTAGIGRRPSKIFVLLAWLVTVVAYPGSLVGASKRRI